MQSPSAVSDDGKWIWDGTQWISTDDVFKESDPGSEDLSVSSEQIAPIPSLKTLHLQYMTHIVFICGLMPIAIHLLVGEDFWSSLKGAYILGMIVLWILTPLIVYWVSRLFFPSSRLKGIICAISFVAAYPVLRAVIVGLLTGSPSNGISDASDYLTSPGILILTLLNLSLDTMPYAGSIAGGYLSILGMKEFGTKFNHKLGIESKTAYSLEVGIVIAALAVTFSGFFIGGGPSAAYLIAFGIITTYSGILKEISHDLNYSKLILVTLGFLSLICNFNSNLALAPDHNTVWAYGAPDSKSSNTAVFGLVGGIYAAYTVFSGLKRNNPRGSDQSRMPMSPLFFIAVSSLASCIVLSTITTTSSDYTVANANMMDLSYTESYDNQTSQIVFVKESEVDTEIDVFSNARTSFNETTLKCKEVGGVLCNAVDEDMIDTLTMRIQILSPSCDYNRYGQHSQYLKDNFQYCERYLLSSNGSDDSTKVQITIANISQRGDEPGQNSTESWYHVIIFDGNDQGYKFATVVKYEQGFEDALSKSLLGISVFLILPYLCYRWRKSVKIFRSSTISTNSATTDPTIAEIAEPSLAEIHPSQSLSGMIGNDGYEWLSHGGAQYYRAPHTGQEWTRWG